MGRGCSTGAGEGRERLGGGGIEGFPGVRKVEAQLTSAELGQGSVDVYVRRPCWRYLFSRSWALGRACAARLTGRVVRLMCRGRRRLGKVPGGGGTESQRGTKDCPWVGRSHRQSVRCSVA